MTGHPRVGHVVPEQGNAGSVRLAGPSLCRNPVKLDRKTLLAGVLDAPQRHRTQRNPYGTSLSPLVEDIPPEPGHPDPNAEAGGDGVPDRVVRAAGLEAPDARIGQACPLRHGSALPAKDRRHSVDGIAHRLVGQMDVFESRFRLVVAEQTTDGQDGFAGLKCQTRVAVAQIMQADVPQARLVSQFLPELVQTLCRSCARFPRKDPNAGSGQAIQDRAGGGGQPDGPRSRLAVPQEQVAVAEVLPLKGHDLAPPAAGQQQQPHGSCHGMAVMPLQHCAQSPGFIPGQEPFAAAPSVAPNVPARIASFRTKAKGFGLPHDHGQDRRRPVGGGRGRSEGGEPLLDVRARDGADRLFPKPGKDLVLQVTAVDVERAGLPVPGLPAEDGVRDVLERRSCGELCPAGRIARPAPGQMRPRKIPRIGQGHRACIADFRPGTLPVDLGVHEITLAAGWQDADTEASEFRVANLADGLAGLEGVDQSLGKAATGHGFSPESVALTDRNEAKRLHSGALREREYPFCSDCYGLVSTARCGYRCDGRNAHNERNDWAR